MTAELMEHVDVPLQKISKKKEFQTTGIHDSPTQSAHTTPRRTTRQEKAFFIMHWFDPYIPVIPELEVTSN